VVDFNVQLDIVMDTSVYLVSYDRLLVETTTHKNCLCLFISVFIVQKIKIKKKTNKTSNRSCPCLSGCFQSTLSLSVYSVPSLIFQLKNPGLFICSAIFDDDT